MSHVFEHPVRVYWEDTDAGGIVFYANYLKFFERARTEWLRTLGVGQRTLREQSGGMFVVSEARLQYHAPARLDDAIIVTAKPMEIGRASLTIDHQALLKDEHSGTAPGLLLCAGQVRIGWVDATSLRPARIPSALLELFS